MDAAGLIVGASPEIDKISESDFRFLRKLFTVTINRAVISTHLLKSGFVPNIALCYDHYDGRFSEHRKLHQAFSELKGKCVRMTGRGWPRDRTCPYLMRCSSADLAAQMLCEMGFRTVCFVGVEFCGEDHCRTNQHLGAAEGDPNPQRGKWEEGNRAVNAVLAVKKEFPHVNFYTYFESDSPLSKALRGA